MAAQELDLTQAKQAIAALYKYNNSKSENDMLDSAEEKSIFIQITTHKIMNKAQLKKTRIPLKVSPFASNVEVCLITKDSEKVMEDKVKSVSPVKKVISVSTLGSTYKNFEARRKLCDSYDIFLVDDRVVHLMPKLLGKHFFAKNKAPVAIKVSSLKKSVESALNATYVKLNNGINTLVSIGNFGLTEEQILENYETAVPELVKIVAHTWKQVQLIGIKSSQSPILPIYTALPTVDDEEEKKEEPVKAAAPAKKEVAKKAAAKKAAPAKKEAAPAKKAAAPAKKAAAAKKEIPVAPAKKAETKKVTKKVVKSKK
ncbi:ribosomal protein L1p/L10e family-domain-containing protein [Helicostylum pulchrum]|nr:ribosomal protein L1p/L10e family-domain-containing protein [Helicostylum pulchrum]